MRAVPIKNDVRLERELEDLLVNLNPDTPWRERQIAAQKLGNLANPNALPAMLNFLRADPFWMVRCALIQAVEIIGDIGAVATLQEVAAADDFEIVRGYAAQAIERLTV
ncbi:MAG: HEAT repeat domain-containing protein [Anaerolineales bacterium]